MTYQLQPRPMRSFWFVLFLLGLAHFSLAQTLTGKVILGPKATDPPLGEVRLSVPGFTEQLSDPESGIFTLSLPGLQPGDQIPLNIQKAGYAVINQQALNPILPLQSQLPLMIHMAPIEQRDQMAISYYQIRIEQKIDQDFQDEWKRVMDERAPKLDVDRISRMARERDAALAQAELMAEALAKVDLDHASALYQRAFSFFPHQIDSVLGILEEDLLDAELKKAEELAAQAKVSKAQTIEGYLLRGQALILTHEFLLAQRNFQKAVDADTTDASHLMMFGEYLMVQKQPLQAQEIYHMALRHERDTLTRAQLLHNLGISYRYLNQHPEALEILLQSKVLFQHLLTQDQEKTEPYWANFLIGLGGVHRDLYQLDTAVDYLQDATEILRRLAQQEPFRFQASLVRALNNLGIAYRGQNRRQEAFAIYQEAVGISRALTADNPQRYEKSLSNSLNNLGLAHVTLGRYAEAIPVYQEALAIDSQLARQNPQRYEPEIAGIHDNLGNAYSLLGRHAEATASHHEALKRYRKLAIQSPEQFEPNVARTLTNLGNAYNDQHRYPEAMAALDEAYRVFWNLAAVTPERFSVPLVYPLATSVDVLKNWLAHAAEDTLQENGEIYTLRLDSVLATLPDIPLKAYVEAQNQLFKSFFASADLKELGLLIPATHLKDSLSFIDSLPLRIAYQKRVISAYEEVLKGYPNAPTVGDSLDHGLGQLAQWQLLNQAYSEAQQTAQRCLDLRETSAHGHRWLAPALLLQGQFKAAKRRYVKQAPSSWPGKNHETFREVYLADLDMLQKAGSAYPDIERMKSILAK